MEGILWEHSDMMLARLVLCQNKRPSNWWGSVQSNSAKGLHSTSRVKYLQTTGVSLAFLILPRETTKEGPRVAESGTRTPQELEVCEVV